MKQQQHDINLRRTRKMGAQKLGCRLHSKYMIRVINHQRLIITGDTGFFQDTLHGIDYYIVLFFES